jgi:nitrite reductase/ring-hydroxylating ferredoxin subunit
MDGSGITDWAAVAPLDELTDGRSHKVEAFGTTVLLIRSGERLFAVANRCTHQGAGLDRGVARLEGSMPTVTCPAHGSVFSLEDGGVRRGPATTPIAAFDARVADGIVELRPRDGAGSTNPG